MPLYKSNLLLNLSIQTTSSAESTQDFSEEVSQEIYEVLEEHLQETADHYDISTEALTTELVSVTPEYTPLVTSSQNQEDYVSLQSLNARSQSAESSYTPLVR
jgi:hypothetical protein